MPINLTQVRFCGPVRDAQEYVIMQVDQAQVGSSGPVSDTQEDVIMPEDCYVQVNLTLMRSCGLLHYVIISN